MEIQHSVTADAVHETVNTMGYDAIKDIVQLPRARPCRLINPRLSFDDHCVALSFMPAADELPYPCRHPDCLRGDNHACEDTGGNNETKDRGNDSYTYHHLRRDLYHRITAVGATVGSRYVVPSCHITLSRFTTNQDHMNSAEVQYWVEAIIKLNEWLRREYWVESGVQAAGRGQWIIGREGKVLCQMGTLWFGGGRTVARDELLESQYNH